MAPCIEVVGYRQRKKGITSFGDLCSDFGANVKFLVGSAKKYKKINVGNLKTNISNKKIGQSVNGNTNTVYINPLNSLRFVLNKVKKDKINLNKDFWLFTGAYTLGIMMRAVNAFGEIKDAFNVFLYNWVQINRLRSIHKRLSEFEIAINFGNKLRKPQKSDVRA